MGNVPISCCRSKSPRLNRSSSSSNSRGNSSNLDRNGNSQYSSINNQNQAGKFTDRQLTRHGEEYEPSHILQHISEREPDDSETDPSSNPFNRPIFATRSSNSTKNKSTSNNNYYDSYSSNNSTTRRQTNTPLMSSQDHGYNSATTSTNLTHLDGLQLNDSFESSIQKQHQQNLLIKENNYIENNHVGGSKKVTSDKSNDDNGLFLLNSTTNTNNDDLFNSSLNVSVRFTPTTTTTTTSQCYHSTRYLNNSNIPKASSCSTIYIDESTISQPDLTLTIKCVSLAIYYHIKNRTSDSSAEIFDETIHPLKVPVPTVTSATTTPSAQQADDELIILESSNDEYNNSKREINEPDQKTIYNFVDTLFKAAQLTSEYAITTLVYLERLMTYAEMDLSPKTWRRTFLGAILLSSKVWEDQAVWNVDYAQILEEISVEDINELERQFLELIQFNMNVPSSVYAKYYFYLRTLAFKNGLIKKQKPMTVGEAKTLEAMFRVNNDEWQSSPIHRKTSSPKLKRHTSLEKSRLNGLAKAVLM